MQTQSYPADAATTPPAPVPELVRAVNELTPAAVALAPTDYTHASCAEQKRTDWRDEPVIALVPSTKRKASSYTERTKHFFALDTNDIVAAHLMGVK